MEHWTNGYDVELHEAAPLTGTHELGTFSDDADVAGRNVTKSELIQRLAELHPHLYHRDVERITTAIFDEIASALSRGDRVELRGFGAFFLRRRDARMGRNPRTGASVQVTERFFPAFRTGKELRERLNREPEAVS